MSAFATFLRDIPFSTRGRKTTRLAVYKAFDKTFEIGLADLLPTSVVAEWRETTPVALLESGKLFAEFVADYLDTQGMDRR